LIFEALPLAFFIQSLDVHVSFHLRGEVVAPVPRHVAARVLEPRAGIVDLQSIF